VQNPPRIGQPDSELGKNSRKTRLARNPIAWEDLPARLTERCAIKRPPGTRTMKFLPQRILFTLCAIALASSAGRAAEPDSRALASLRRMSDTLAAAKAFTFRSRSISEVRAKNGQSLTLFSVADVALKRPDKLRVRFAGEAPHFDFYYDGTVAAAFAPGTGTWSVTKAPPTIDAMLPALERETGIRMVTAGLLADNPFKAMSADVSGGIFVGTVSINGVACDHLAFRADGADWEIWIESGKRALPVRLAVTYTERPNRPRVLVEFFDWNLHPGLRPGDFIFRPPSGSREIPFQSVPKS
jgi:hypothetical protein